MGRSATGDAWPARRPWPLSRRRARVAPVMAIVLFPTMSLIGNKATGARVVKFPGNVNFFAPLFVTLSRNRAASGPLGHLLADLIGKFQELSALEVGFVSPTGSLDRTT